MALGKDRVVVHGSFRPNGSSGVVAGSQQGIGWTVSRTAAGKYVLQLLGRYPRLISAQGTARSATGVPTAVTFGVYTAANGTLELFVAQESTGTLTNADMAANADNVVNFELIFCNSASNY